jgi:hypothetical protein
MQHLSALDDIFAQMQKREVEVESQQMVAI